MRRPTQILGLFVIALSAAGCMHAVGPRPPLLPTSDGVSTVGVAAGTLPGTGFDEQTLSIQFHRTFRRRDGFPDVGAGVSLMNGWAPFRFSRDPPRTALIDLNGFLLAHVINDQRSSFTLEAGVAPYLLPIPFSFVIGGSPYVGARFALRNDRGSAYLRAEAGVSGSVASTSISSTEMSGAHGLAGLGVEVGREQFRLNLEVLGVYRNAQGRLFDEVSTPIERVTGESFAVMASAGVAFDMLW